MFILPQTLKVAIAAAAFFEALRECAQQVTVVEGDTCDSIAAQNGISPSKLFHLNPQIDENCDNLYPGEVLCIAVKKSDSDDTATFFKDPKCSRTVTVVEGDTCDSIAAQNGISPSQLFHLNPQIDENCDNLYPGEVLCVGAKKRNNDDTATCFKGLKCSRTVTVVEGDTCDSIAAQNGISPSQLFHLNPQIDENCDNLYPGEILCISVKKSNAATLFKGSKCSRTVTVVEGDTCDSIAAQNGISPSQLFHLNPQIDENCDNLYPGEVLCIAVKKSNAATLFKALPHDCTRSATVQSGDTCNDISAKYGVSTYQLANVNKGIIDDNCDNLQPGQVLCLGLKGRDCTATYVVRSGDTCDRIAAGHHIPVKTLYRNNPNVNQNCTNIYPEEVLCVSDRIYYNN